MSIVLAKNKKILLIFIIILALILIGFRFIDNENYVFINERKIEVDIADEPDELVRGLGGRKSLAEDRGMLFIFENEGKYSFWMKDMLFPIDIIWIKNGKIIGIEKNIAPSAKDSSFLETFPAPDSVKYVLEVNAGYCDEHGIDVADSVKFEL